jgi:hypothetical protein
MYESFIYYISFFQPTCTQLNEPLPVMTMEGLTAVLSQQDSLRSEVTVKPAPDASSATWSFSQQLLMQLLEEAGEFI